MPETRQHRGPHPEDGTLFAPDQWPALQQAVGHVSWLLSRGYADPSSVKIVGDRFRLQQRQRIAVRRTACSDQALRRRRDHEIRIEDVAGQSLWLDGFNLITTVEAAMANGVLLLGRDGCLRDMASMHGSYRKVRETVPAVRRIGEVAEQLDIAGCVWYLDRPVSNSGRLKAILEETAAEHAWSWTVRVVRDPDVVLMAAPGIVVSADRVILDSCARWCNLGRTVVERTMPRACIVDLSRGELSANDEVESDPARDRCGETTNSRGETP